MNIGKLIIGAIAVYIFFVLILPAFQAGFGVGFLIGFIVLIYKDGDVTLEEVLGIFIISAIVGLAVTPIFFIALETFLSGQWLSALIILGLGLALYFKVREK